MAHDSYSKLNKTMLGLVEKFKARLVAQGFSQREGTDYFLDAIYAPVARYATLRCVLAVAAAYDLELAQLDVKTAFLNGILPEEITIFMRPPKGYDCKTGTVFKLLKSIYGLKQSPYVWNNDINAFLLEQQFIRSETDPCLYTRIRNSEYTILCLYVDDLTIACNNTKILEELKWQLSKRYQMDDRGELEWILGMRVHRDRSQHTIYLNQEQYIKDMLIRFKMNDPNKEPPMATPADPNVILSKSMCPQSPKEKAYMKDKPFSNLVGSLLYAAISTRPDIANAVRAVSRYMANPGPQHWKAARRILRYLKGTLKLGIKFCGRVNGIDIYLYSDASFAMCVDTRRSVTAFTVYWNNGIVNWESRTQPSTARSTTEAEYMAMAEATSESIWIAKVAQDLGIPIHGPITLFEDNSGAIALANTRKHMRRTKHIDVRYHFVREKRESGFIDFIFCETKHMIADLLTKNLPRPAFERIRKFLLGQAYHPAYDQSFRNKDSAYFLD